VSIGAIAKTVDGPKTDILYCERFRDVPTMLRKRPFRTATILLTVATCLAISVFLLTRRTIPKSSSVHAQQPPIEPGSIDDHVQRANAEGRLLVTLPMEIMGESVEGFDDATGGYSIVVAQAVSKQSFAVSAYDVETWYKFTITETLLTNTPHICFDNECPLPAELPAAGSNEMWLSKSGGVIVRNGVTVDFQEVGFPDFNIGQTYLLFVDLNQTTKVGATTLGGSGVYLVDNNGHLAPVLGDESDLSSDISSRFGNSLTQLRNFLNPPPPPPSGCDPAQQQNCIDNGGTWNSNNCSCFNLCIQKPWLCD